MALAWPWERGCGGGEQSGGAPARCLRWPWLLGEVAPDREQAGEKAAHAAVTEAQL